jgi:hypothetical protein
MREDEPTVERRCKAFKFGAKSLAQNVKRSLAKSGLKHQLTLATPAKEIKA